MGAALCLAISGPVGSGKTTSLRAALAALARRGHGLVAIIQPDIGRGADGLALGFELELLSAGGGELVSERLPLALAAGAPRDLSVPGAAFGRFVFDDSAFARAEAFLRVRLAAQPRPELLALDEIGRLELARGGGLAPCLELALGAAAAPEGPRLVILACRDAFLPELGAFFAPRGFEPLVVAPGEALARAEAVLSEARPT
jgi:nucleoside-triphosphatase THEP1